MITPTDDFFKHYTPLLDSMYDCVDRIVLNAYFYLGQNPGGFRSWWRRLMGTDDNLDKNHLMRMAGRFSRRLRGWAKSNNIPIEYCFGDDDKHKLGEEHFPSDPNFRGIFLVIVSRAPAPVWEVLRSPDGKTIWEIRHPDTYPYVNHYHFHIKDPEWGHMTIRMCSHPPFTAQIILNGHEYVEGQARKRDLSFTKEGNCFTEISDARRLAEIADTLCSQNAIGQLRQVCERWIYSCLCLALDTGDQERTGFKYGFSFYQMEYSRNGLFLKPSALDEIFEAVIDRTRGPLDLRTILKIFGYRQRPKTRSSKRGGKWNRKGRKKTPEEPKIQVSVEKPHYDMTIFKITCDKLTVKFYTKGERVLRAEVVMHNARKLPGSPKYSLPELPNLISLLQGILERFLNGVSYVDNSFVSLEIFEGLHSSSNLGKSRIPGLEINKPRIRAVMQALIVLMVSPNGFRSIDLAAKVREITGWSDDEYKVTQASYDLKKFRAKDFVQKIGKTRRYDSTPHGARAMAALHIISEKAIKPLLAGVTNIQTAAPNADPVIDVHYQRIQNQVNELFKILGIAA